MKQFKENLDTAVFTTKHVLEKKSPIIHVYHYDEDGAWQFSGSEVVEEDEDFRVVSLEGNTQSAEQNDGSQIGNASTVAGIAYFGLGKIISNNSFWVDANGNIRSTELLEKGANGKYVRGVQGIRNSQEAASRAASNYKIAGKVVGGLGMFVTGFQFLDGQISGTEASVDLIMGGIGFTGWGAPISLTYFGGKFLYEYSTGNTVFEKPGGN